MLVSNTLRFCTDIFGALEEEDINKEQDGDVSGEIVSSTKPTASSFEKRALLISKSTYWDCTDKIAVTGFDITEFAPEGTKVRIMFKIGNKFGRVYNDGSFLEFTDPIDVTTVLKHGNTNAGLLAKLTDVPCFVGQKVYPIIALQATSDAVEMPSIKIGIKAISGSNVLTKIVESDPITLTDEATLPRIVSITPSTNCTGGGEVTVKVSLSEDGDNWTAFMELADAADQEALAVKFKFTYKVDTPNSIDSACVKFMTIAHTLGKMIVSGETADLYTVVQDYDIPLQMCHVTVRHSPLIDSQIEAYVNFMHAPKHRELLKIGTGNGALKEFVLGESATKPDLNIDASTIQLYVGPNPVTNFSYNSETSTVTFKATNTANVFASYDYDHDVEVWKKMTLDVTEPYNSETRDCASRFTYALSDAEAEDKLISNVRIVTKRPTGTVTNMDLGYGNKHTRLIVLPHRPKAASITFTEDGVSHIYNEDANTLAFAAKTTTPVIVSYTWQGEPVTITGISCGWSVA